jgi:cell division protein FtsB
VRLNVVRLALLVLVLLGAAAYISPLRDFFAQQDRYQREAAVLAREQSQNTGLRQELDRMKTRDYITRQAREEFQLVPKDTQAFVVKGLDDGGASPSPEPTPEPESQSVVARLADLWKTVSQ